MHRNLLPRRYPVLTQIAQNDRKSCIEGLLTHSENSQPSRAMTRRSEFVHATVEDDLIGPGHVRSRSRSRTRDAATRRSGGQRSTSSKPSSSGSALMMKPGLEIHLPQRGRFIVVEDVRTTNKKTKSWAPEFVLVNKENGRAIPLHSLYQNPQRSVESVRFTTPADPPVDYHDYPSRQPPGPRRHANRSLSDESDEGHGRASSSSYSPSLCKHSVNNCGVLLFSHPRRQPTRAPLGPCVFLRCLDLTSVSCWEGG